jgi:CelD/BcsL family acetyltransferase involved in cellulose biosynthesis
MLPRSERAQAAAAWTSLESRIGNTGLACSWDWTSTWLEVYGSQLRHAFAVGEHGGVVCGIALLVWETASHHGLPIRRLHVGTAGEPSGTGVNVEYNRLLVDEDAREAYGAALLGVLLEDSWWDELVLDGFASEDAHPLRRTLPAFEPRVRASPYLDLQPRSDRPADVLAALSAGTRRRIRRSLRAFGEVETEWAETPDQGLAILDELVVLHQRRWQAAGKPGAFASERFRRFHSTLIARLLPKGAILAFRTRVGSGTLGCVYGFVERGRVLFYQSGFAAFDDRKLKPGLVTHALCMQAAADGGYMEYDFLPGRSRYKSELTSGEHEVVWAIARRSDLKSASSMVRDV